jgi:predicted Rossmann-fold nucleotide-binding protein
MRGFRTFHFLGPCVTVFCASRFIQSYPYYERTREVAFWLARAGFTVKEAGGIPVECNIQLPREQRPNAYLDCWITFRHFIVRTLMWPQAIGRRNIVFAVSG